MDFFFYYRNVQTLHGEIKERVELSLSLTISMYDKCSIAKTMSGSLTNPNEIKMIRKVKSASST